jgi:hypothetical protein
MPLPRTSPPPIPVALRRADRGSGVHRRPVAPKAPPRAKLPPRKPAAANVQRLYPVITADDEDTVVEEIDDPFDALLRAPQPPPIPTPMQARARDSAFRALDLAEGAIACFGKHRDARVLSALVAAATLRFVLPVALLCVLVASYRPEPALVKETRPKPAPATVVVPMIVPVIVRQAVEEERPVVRPRRARRHRRS